MNLFLPFLAFVAVLSVENRLLSLEEDSDKPVKLHLSNMGPWLAPAYHSSISIDDLELSFSNMGISTFLNTRSHRGKPHYSNVFGVTSISSKDAVEVLKQRFRTGTYDLLRKNCNHFSECALALLLG